MSKAHKCEVCEELVEGQSRKTRNFTVDIRQFNRRASDITLLEFDVVWNYTKTSEFKNKASGVVDLCDECFDQVILRIAKAILHPLDPGAITDAELSRRIRVDERDS
jgi:hypothetical protein